MKPLRCLALIVALAASGCALVRSPLVDGLDAGPADVPGLDAPRPDVPGLDAPEPDVPGLDAPDVPVPPDAPPDAGCTPTSVSETACDRRDENCDGVIDGDDVCGCDAITVAGRAYLSCPPASGIEAWSGACGSHAPGYQLVTLGATEQRNVLDALDAAGITETHWIGLNDFEENGIYVWFDRSTAFTPMTVGVDDPAKRCVQLRPNGEYEELPCTDSHRLLCEAVVAPGACRGTAEASGCNGIDENCNGQVDEGFDCGGNGCDNFTFWDSVYYVCIDETDWASAASTCMSAAGAALVTLSSDIERLEVGSRSGEVWVGLSQSSTATATDAGWSWEMASSYALPPSGPPWDGGSGGQPDDGLGVEDHEQDCGSMRGDDDFEDDPCADRHDFVCERTWTY